MADFGADVIKIEAPGKGDPFRALGPYHNKEPMRWAVMSRNKRTITLDLRKPSGKETFLKLVEKSDVLIENFRTGTLDKWGLDMETLHKANPKLVVTRVTGYGQTGPYAPIAGFGTPATAFSGMTYLTGYPDRPPVSPSFSLVDYVAGLYAAMGTMMALYHRDVLKGKAQEVDVSLYEAIFRMLEIPVADYHKNRRIRERTPGLSGTSSPGGTYETRDGKWVVLVCSTDRTWEYLTVAMNNSELLTNPLFATMRIVLPTMRPWTRSCAIGSTVWITRTSRPSPTVRGCPSVWCTALKTFFPIRIMRRAKISWRNPIRRWAASRCRA
jgi:formyl-CoA transferase